MRKLLVLILIAALGLMPLTASAQAATHTVPEQGIFDDCPINYDVALCEQRAVVAKGMGLKLLVEPVPAPGPDATAYLAALRADGLQVIWEVDDPTLWADPSSIDAAALDSPATWGWYVADDTQLGLGTAQVQQFAQALKAAAPGTRTLISSYDPNTQFLIAYGVADVTAQESYPLVAQAPSRATTALVGSETYAEQVTVARYARAHGGGATAAILQSFSWGECSDSEGPANGRYPTSREMVAIRNAAIAAHPSLILWFSLWETIGWPTGTPSECSAPDPGRTAALTAAVKAPTSRRQ